MIEKKEFQKLKQLDRIEYMLKLKRIEERYEGSVTLTYVNLILLLFAVFGIAMLVSFYISTELFLAFSNLIRIVASYTIPFLLLGLLMDCISMYYSRKAKRELNEEFFKVDVRSKR